MNWTLGQGDHFRRKILGTSLSVVLWESGGILLAAPRGAQADPFRTTAVGRPKIGNKNLHQPTMAVLKAVLLILALSTLTVGAKLAHPAPPPPSKPIGSPLLSYNISQTVQGTANFTQTLPGVGAVFGGVLPAIFSIDAAAQRYVFWEAVTAQYTYSNGTYTILPETDANGTIIGYACFYDKNATFASEVARHMQAIKVAEVYYPGFVNQASHGSSYGFSNDSPSQHLSNPHVRGLWQHNKRLSSLISDSLLRISSCNKDGLDRYDQYFGLVRDVGAADGRMALTTLIDPDTGFFRSFYYSATGIEQVLPDECQTCVESELIGTGIFEYLSASPIPDQDTIALNPICYGADIPYSSLGCHK